jgi:hypothetical protein
MILPDIRTMFLFYRNKALKDMKEGKYESAQKMIEKMEMLLGDYRSEFKE